ncbi:t-SNARE domain-containing protein 1 [Acropora cervicornis]|uniref:t-SNARE domain-containing protein 1 n=1 Tax=Acropora cervicornis TaxID=6130 RepID=A0AAD9PRU9_ACRCE|nr:t-SNARE domain-containing protein 1 [Acropora cervicornis]
MAESVAGREEINSEAKERKRKPNFSVYEIGVITENVQKHLETIQSKLTNNITNKKKQQVWEEITRAVNAVGTANRTVSEVKDKWKNLHKRVEENWRRAAAETPSVSSKEIIEVFEDTPGFSGLNGFETVSKATLPYESATVSDELLSNTDRSLGKTVEDEFREEKKKRKGKKQITYDDVLEQQFNALVAKQENLALKKRKLELELYLLEQEVLHGDTTVLTE